MKGIFRRPTKTQVGRGTVIKGVEPQAHSFTRSKLGSTAHELAALDLSHLVEKEDS